MSNKNVQQRMSKNVPERMLKHMPESVLEDMSKTMSKERSKGAQTIPRSLANDILSVLPHLPSPWPLLKSTSCSTRRKILQYLATFFFHANELLRTFLTNKQQMRLSRPTRLGLWNFVQFLSEWIVMEQGSPLTVVDGSLNSAARD